MNATEQFVLSVIADDKPGLLSRILNILDRRCIIIDSVSAARTDTYHIVWVTLEINIEPSGIQNLLNQIEKIIEVFRAEAKLLRELCCQRMSLIKVSASILTTDKAGYIRKFGAQVMHQSKDTLILQKTGTDEEIREMYHLLGGKELLGYYQSGLLAYTSMINLERNNSSTLNSLSIQ
jgi:acetolactate synthase-1/3 small subunit